ncbi:hypothetical protein DERP_006566 [Dermatophagoides pteronyssinus]|uniref:Uncharacterized protein n=1 Tax=Dermatophagoides pteronyssinus TaxID=6956 RepID=A0ABQ8IQM1_DERPT|nr:hypothetical protein DERP_006566 [Dermatophagoides pteronyssinus]
MDILQQQQQTKLIVLVDAKARRRLSITKNHSKNFIENSITENQLTSNHHHRSLTLSYTYALTFSSSSTSNVIHAT